MAPPQPRRYLEHRLKLRHLQAIEAIGAQRSIAGAAKAMGLTQPSLTRALHEIETALGVQLFERHAKGVSETPFGRAAAESASVIMGELKRLDEALDRLMREATETFAVGALPVAAVGVMPAVLARLSLKHHELQVRLIQGRTEELLPALQAGAVDVVVGRLYDPPSPDGLVREALYAEDFAVLGRADHPIFLTPVTPHAVAAYRLALPTISQRVGQEIEQLVAQLPPGAAPPLRSSSVAFIREVLQQSDLLTVMPRVMMAGDIDRGVLRAAALPIAAAPRPAGLIFRRGPSAKPGLDDLIASIRDQITHHMASHKATEA